MWSIYIIQALNIFVIMAAAITIKEILNSKILLNKLSTEAWCDLVLCFLLISMIFHWLFTNIFLLVGLIDIAWSLLDIGLILSIYTKYRNITKRIVCYHGSNCFKKGYNAVDR